VGRKQPGNADRAIRILFVGWVKREKGIGELVKACSELEGRYQFELHIVGPVDSAIQPELDDCAAILGDRLVLHGELSHEATMGLMSQADMLALPSYTEGFPNVVLEAMACSVPVVATRVGAVAQIIESESMLCGVCIPPRDVDALTDALDVLLRNHELRRILGTTGRTLAEEIYSPAKIFDALVRVWCSGSKNIGHGGGAGGGHAPPRPSRRLSAWAAIPFLRNRHDYHIKARPTEPPQASASNSIFLAY